MLARNNRLNRNAQRGFTLVEMLIVGALIALFSSIAIFGVQQQYRSNQRKAIIGEARQIATALDFAYQDVGFFPKIAYLQHSSTNLLALGEQSFGNSLGVAANLSQYGFNTTSINPNTFFSEVWAGPYFSASGSRSQVAQGRGGSRNMFLSAADESNGVAAFDYPVDTYNNPYMLYSLNIITGASPTLTFTTENVDTSIDSSGSLTQVITPNTSDAGVEGTFINAVVSYGPNQVPGGNEFSVIAENQAERTNTAGTTFPATSPYGIRLYSGEPDNTQDPLRLFDGNQLSQGAAGGIARANAWSVCFADNAGTAGSLAARFDLDDGCDTNLPECYNNNASYVRVGITDCGSDDVVFTY